MTDESSPPVWANPLIVADLPTKRATRFDLRPDSGICDAIVDAYGLLGLRKLRFSGEIQTDGKSDWVLRGRFGATLAQACVVSLAPVTTRIDEDVVRHYLRDGTDIEEGSELEMPQDDTIEPLGTVIDPGLVMVETLALLVPQFPRAAGAELGQTLFAEPGVKPMSDADARPFAALKSLTEKPDDTTR